MNKAAFEKLTIRGKLGEMNRRRRHNKKRSQKRKRLACIARLQRYGQEAVDAYKATLNTNHSGHPKQRQAAMLRSLLASKLGEQKISQSTYHRILNLNTIAGLPLLNVGWNCLACSIQHSNFRFFEIDHIIQVNNGGSNQVENLQILCPNCHKKKSLQIDGFSLHQSFRTPPDEI